MGWDKHEEVKVVHEMKQEVGSRDEARRTEKSNQWFSEKSWCVDNLSPSMFRASATSFNECSLSFHKAEHHIFDWDI